MPEEIPDEVLQKLFDLAMPGYPVQLMINAVAYEDRSTDTVPYMMSFIGPNWAVIPIESAIAAGLQSGVFESEEGDKPILDIYDHFSPGFAPIESVGYGSLDVCFINFEDREWFPSFQMELGNSADIRIGSYYKVADISVKDVGSTYEDDGIVMDIPSAEVHIPEGKVLAVHELDVCEGVPIEFAEMNIPACDLIEGAALMNADGKVIGIHIKHSNYSEIEDSDNAMFISCKTIAYSAQLQGLKLNGSSYDEPNTKKKRFFNRLF